MFRGVSWATPILLTFAAPSKRPAGTVPAPYRDCVREAASPDYRQRTRLDVEDSDGTVIFTFGPLTGGARFTRTVADQKRKLLKTASALPLGVRGNNRFFSA